MHSFCTCMLFHNTFKYLLIQGALLLTNYIITLKYAIHIGWAAHKCGYIHVIYGSLVKHESC